MMMKVAVCSLMVWLAQELPVLVTEDFEKGMEKWEFSDPKAWKIVETDKGKSLGPVVKAMRDWGLKNP